MADYNIYIHDLSNGSSSTPTKAWNVGSDGSSQTKAWQTLTKQSEDGGSGGGSNVGTPNFLSMKGMWSAAKSHPVVTVAIAVVTLAIKTVDAVTPFVTRETGDYRWAGQWNNAKATIGMLLKPVSSAINGFTSHQETTIFNKQQERTRDLIGERAYTNLERKRGV